MARPKSSQHELKRDEILDVAAQCFAERSYPSASMNDIAAAGGTSKARLYHYYESKEAILFDLLDRYTQRLLALIGEAEATAQRRSLDDRAMLHELVRSFLQEYEHSATRHVALLHDTKFLGDNAARADPEPATRRGVGCHAVRAPRVSRPRRRGQPDAGGDDAVRHDQLDLHLAAAGRPAELLGLRRRSHRHARAWPGAMNRLATSW